MTTRDPSMEDILASIKRVIAEEKEIRATAPPAEPAADHDAADSDDDVLELDEIVGTQAPSMMDLGPPLLETRSADESRQRLEELANIAATAPPPAPAANPLEEVVREMLRPILKQWLDDHLPQVVDEHVKREIHRITGRPV